MKKQPNGHPVRRTPPAGKGRVIRVPTPKTRDPFVNTPLISLGPDEAGEERFWISSLNCCVGCLGVLFKESGWHRMYKFGSGFSGFYSAVLEDRDTLWLCCDLSKVVRLSLGSGRYEAFETGASPALMFQGMILDPATGKLFAAAYPMATSTTTAFSFDFRNRRPVKVHENIGADHYMRFSFPNGDGTYSFVLHVPGESLGRWDPRTETVEVTTFNPELDSENFMEGTTYALVADDQGRRYFPGRGWYDSSARLFHPHSPPPEREMTWFARRGDHVWGIVAKGNDGLIGRWDLRTGRVQDLASIPDASIHSLNLSASNKLVAVTTYGDFMRLDGETGALELSRRLPADGIQMTDCLCRIDKDRLLGTAFIAQRFWEVNLKTGKGEDCGRAAPGHGEILETWKLGGKLYMAAYTGGELTEYDPTKPARFPENPRVVADPPNGMRPVAKADDGRRLYYACNHPYGKLGSALARYDTRTGETFYRDNPIPGQAVGSLWYDRATHGLLCGTTMKNDAARAPASTDRCFFARLDADTLEVLDQAPAPAGAEWAQTVGVMGRGRCLCRCHGAFADGTRRTPWFVMDTRAFRVPPLEEMKPMPDDILRLVSAGRPGLFVHLYKDRCELWDWRKERRVVVLHRDDDCWWYCHCSVQDDSVYLVKSEETIVLDGCLKGYR